MKPIRNPYIGPRAFVEGEPLFGRDDDTADLVDLLLSDRIVLLYAPSGAGKTSLIEAALRPKLTAKGFSVLPTMRVGYEPDDGAQLPEDTNPYLLSLLHSLEEGLNPESATDPMRLAATTLEDYLTAAKSKWNTDASRGLEVLIFDQFEEIFTRGSKDPFEEILPRGSWDERTAEARRQFFKEVGGVLRDPERWAIFSMREDFIAGLDPYLGGIPTRLSNTYRLELLDNASAVEAISKPAELEHVSYEADALHTLVADLSRVTVRTAEGSEDRSGMFVEPVQLQIVCRRLWEALDRKHALDDKVISKSAVEDVAGEVDEALGVYYQETVREACQQSGVAERTIRDWLGSQLITENGLRTQVQGGLEQKAIEVLRKAFLVRTGTRRGTTWFELAHDRLIRPIRANNKVWRRENLPPLQRVAAIWSKNRSNNSLLFQGNELSEAERWAEENTDYVTEIERDYLEACREARRFSTKRLRRRWFAVTAAVLVGLVGLSAALVTQQRLEALHTLHHHRLVLDAQLQIEQHNHALGALLAREAYLEKEELVDQNVVSDQLLHDRTVLRVLEESTRPSYFGNVLMGDDSVVRTVAFSPDGRTLVSGDSDGFVRIWDVVSNRGWQTARDMKHTGRVYTAAFSPDGTWLAAGAHDGTIRIWNRKPESESYSAPTDLKVNDQTITAIAFRPGGDDGPYLAAAGEDSKVRLWGRVGEKWKSKAELSGHESKVRSIAFSPDGRWLASGDDGGRVIIWEFGNPPNLIAQMQHAGQQNVYSLEFIGDGSWLAAASSASEDEHGVSLWDLQAPSDPKVGTFLPHRDKIRSLASSRDGDELYASTYAGEVVQWRRQASSWSEIAETMTGHAGLVFQVVVSSNNAFVASAGEDGTVRRWEPQEPEPTRTLPTREPVTAIRFSGEIVEVEMRVEEAMRRYVFSNASLSKTRMQSRSVRLPSKEAGSVDIASDGEGLFVASLGVDYKLRVWSTDGKGKGAPEVIELERTLDAPGHPPAIGKIALSADGRWLALASGLIYKDHDENPAGRVRLLRLGRPEARWRDLNFANYRGELSVYDGDGFASIAFSRDGQWLAAGSYGGKIRRWNLTELDNDTTVLNTNRGEVSSIAFSPDGRALALGHASGQVVLSEAARPEFPIVFEGPAERVTAVAFSPDGHRLLSGNERGVLRSFELGPALAARVCRLVIHNASDKEWERFFPGESYRCTCPALGPGPGVALGACPADPN